VAEPMTTNDPDVIDEPESISQREAVGLLAAFVEFRQIAKEAQERRDQVGALLRDYLERHPGEALRDGERNIEARLQSRSTGARYDTAAMTPDLILQLWRLNLLNVDTKMAAALKGRSIAVNDIERYKTPGGTTTALLVAEP
jgi:hypothetical protein